MGQNEGEKEVKKGRKDRRVPKDRGQGREKEGACGEGRGAGAGQGRGGAVGIEAGKKEKAVAQPLWRLRHGDGPHRAAGSEKLQKLHQ